MLISIVSVFVLFSIIILVHELGHFLVAKKVGIKIDTFSLGFGPKIFSWKKGETVYQVCLLPFGGFVKMAGEEYGDKEEFEQWEYMGKAPGLRARVLAAGSLNNLLFGFLLLIPVFMLGVPGYDGTKIGSFLKGMPAEKSGLKAGDEIVEVNGKRCGEWFDVLINIRKSTSEYKGQTVEIKVKRDGEFLTFKIKPASHEVTGLSGKKEISYIVGIMPKEKNEKYSFFRAIPRAMSEFKKMIYGVFLAFKLLFTKQVSFKGLSGPVGIAQWSAKIVHSGISRFLYFMCFISVNLGIINLLPFPVLDGGHLFGVLVERIVRKKPRRIVLEIIQYIGAALLITLALYVTYNDILKILQEKIKH